MQDSTTRINISLPLSLVRQLDAAAKDTYTTRSNAIRLALLHWLSLNPRRERIAGQAAAWTEPIRSRTAYDKLSPEQKQMLENFQQGQATFADMIEVGITPEIQLELMELGEL